jgi:hypothetical protein
MPDQICTCLNCGLEVDVTSAAHHLYPIQQPVFNLTKPTWSITSQLSFTFLYTSGNYSARFVQSLAIDYAIFDEIAG